MSGFAGLDEGVDAGGEEKGREDRHDALRERGEGSLELRGIETGLGEGGDGHPQTAQDEEKREGGGGVHEVLAKGRRAEREDAEDEEEESDKRGDQGGGAGGGVGDHPGGSEAIGDSAQENEQKCVDDGESGHGAYKRW